MEKEPRQTYPLLLSLFPAFKRRLSKRDNDYNLLIRQNKQLLIEKKQAEEMAKSKTAFLSTMSHEIRTQLNAISGMTYFLSEENPRPDQQPHIDILNFSSKNLHSLVNDILDLNKINAGKVAFENLDFSVTELLNCILETVRPKANENNVLLHCNIDHEIPEFVMGDPVRLGQVLTNLMGNAVKFTKNGNVELVAKRIDDEDNFISVEFAVIDNGIGIEKIKLDQIFQPFIQASSETTRKFGGTGLGLAISTKLLDLQGSKLEVESQLGQGSTFSFQIEFAKSKRGDQEEKLTPEELLEKPLYGTRLLLAEDNRINQMVAKKFLTKWGVHFDLAEDGMAALGKIKENHYDIVLMDLQMPLMDGYTVTKEVRKMENFQLKDLPIIALTASSMIEERHKVIEAGMNDYVPKPFNPEQLYEAIRGQLALAKAFD